MDHTYKDENLCAPISCVIGEWGLGQLWKGVIVLIYLRHSEGVSCNTSPICRAADISPGSC